MEDLVLEMLLRYKTKKYGERARGEADHFSLQSRSSIRTLKHEEVGEAQTPSFATLTPVSQASSSKNVPVSATDSSSDYDGLSAARTQRNGLQAEYQKQEDASSDARKSTISLRRWTLRLADRIAFKEQNVSSHTKKLQKTYPGQNSDNDSANKAPAHEHSDEQSNGSPLPPPLSQAPDTQSPPSSLPSLPPSHSADHNIGALLPPVEPKKDPPDNIDEKLRSIQDSRQTLKEELDTTQQRLTQLFDSQAVLREKYNAERNRSKTLDAEYQRTHTKIYSLEESTRQLNDELKRLQEYVGSLERSNQQMREKMQAVELRKRGSYDDLYALPSPKPSSRHKLSISPIPAVQPLYARPPPIPRKADRRSVRRQDSPDSPNKSYLRSYDASDEDKSFWEVGDKSATSAAENSTAQSVGRNRRSASMSDDILRKARDGAMEINGRPKRSSSVRLPSNLQQSGLYPHFLDTKTLSGPTNSSFPVLPKPSPNQSTTPLLPEPLRTSHTSLRGTNFDLIFPKPPSKVSDNFGPPSDRVAEPPLQKAKTTNDVHAAHHNLLAPPSVQTITMKQPELATSYFQSSSSSGQPSVQSVAEPTLDAEGRAVHHASPPSVAASSSNHSLGTSRASKAQKLKLKKSLELLPNCAKREVNATAHRQSVIHGTAVSPTSSLLHDRGFSLYRFVNPVPVEGDMTSYDLERLTPSVKTSKIMTSTPTPMKVTFPRNMEGIEGSIGMYDAVSGMWLTPQSLMRGENQRVQQLKQRVAGAFTR